MRLRSRRSGIALAALALRVSPKQQTGMREQVAALKIEREFLASDSWNAEGGAAYRRSQRLWRKVGMRGNLSGQQFST